MYYKSSEELAALVRQIHKGIEHFEPMKVESLNGKEVDLTDLSYDEI